MHLYWEFLWVHCTRLSAGRCRHKAGRCPYSSVTAADSSGNHHCIHAHSDAELDEWRERYQWRQSRKMAAKQQHLYSYMTALCDEYNNDDTDSTVSQLLLLLQCLSLLSVSSLQYILKTNPLMIFTYYIKYTDSLKLYNSDDLEASFSVIKPPPQMRVVCNGAVFLFA